MWTKLSFLIPIVFIFLGSVWKSSNNKYTFPSSEAEIISSYDFCHKRNEIYIPYNKNLNEQLIWIRIGKHLENKSYQTNSDFVLHLTALGTRPSNHNQFEFEIRTNHGSHPVPIPIHWELYELSAIKVTMERFDPKQNCIAQVRYGKLEKQFIHQPQEIQNTYHEES